MVIASFLALQFEILHASEACAETGKLDRKIAVFLSNLPYQIPSPYLISPITLPPPAEREREFNALVKIHLIIDRV